MKCTFLIKIDESLGTIYEKPILNIEGGFDAPEDLEEFKKFLLDEIDKKFKDVKI